MLCSSLALTSPLGGFLQQKARREAEKLRFVAARNLPEPVRTLVWVPRPAKEQSAILKRIEKQNQGVTTKERQVVDRKEDPKRQQLVVLWTELRGSGWANLIAGPS